VVHDLPVVFDVERKSGPVVMHAELVEVSSSDQNVLQGGGHVSTGEHRVRRFPESRM